ncbi:hypothetical protein AB0M97_28885 [Streptomyces sp. NPDC051207]|uniref:hypothetical protein n=1 Tax=Streptomyces sp. NPDC051207 TaxID=3154641 RepID=UPI003442170F
MERNTRHGLPLTRADRNAAALRIIPSSPQGEMGCSPNSSSSTPRTPSWTRYNARSSDGNRTPMACSALSM